MYYDNLEITIMSDENKYQAITKTGKTTPLGEVLGSVNLNCGFNSEQLDNVLESIQSMYDQDAVKFCVKTTTSNT